MSGGPGESGTGRQTRHTRDASANSSTESTQSKAPPGHSTHPPPPFRGLARTHSWRARRAPADGLSLRKVGGPPPSPPQKKPVCRGVSPTAAGFLGGCLDELTLMRAYPGTVFCLPDHVYCLFFFSFLLFGERCVLRRLRRGQEGSKQAINMIWKTGTVLC